MEPVSVAEQRVLELLATYLTVPEIATRLALSPNTVASHVRSLHRKLGATSRSATVERAIELGLLAGRARPQAARRLTARFLLGAGHSAGSDAL